MGFLLRKLSVFYPSNKRDFVQALFSEELRATYLGITESTRLSCECQQESYQDHFQISFVGSENLMDLK